MRVIIDIEDYKGGEWGDITATICDKNEEVIDVISGCPISCIGDYVGQYIEEEYIIDNPFQSR